MESYDYTKPIEISPRIWWVGTYMENDLFQCHVYLLENGDQSVLIDPGSHLTFRYALDKIEQIIPFRKIKYFLCHHQDPDITSSLPLIEEFIVRDDAVILSHWRGIALLKHYGLDMEMQCVEKMGWKLQLEDRELEFIFTPYLHFPGAFVTYDPSSKILFSSDIFGGFTEDWSLFAQDESYFHAMRPFHEHYMPSREILLHSLYKLEKYDIDMIVPQHGSIIRQELMPYIFNRLKGLDCGLFLMTKTSTDINKLTRLNKALKDFMKQMVVSKNFGEVLEQLTDNLNFIIPVDSIEFYTEFNENQILHIGRSSTYSGKFGPLPDKLEGILGLDEYQWRQKHPHGYLHAEEDVEKSIKHGLILPLVSNDTQKIFSIAVISLKRIIEIDDETQEVLLEMQKPFSVSMERELIYRKMEIEKQQFYEQAIRDPLTKLYTRHYMHEAVTRLCLIHNRDQSAGFGLILFDIDNFKSINDTYGHIEGDEVLRVFGEIIRDQTRGGDIQVRYGGEEFAVFMVANDAEAVVSTGLRIGRVLSEHDFSGALSGKRITVSSGMAMHRQGEELTDLIHRSDEALYNSKNTGKDRITRGD
jgi:diguanylate cyclase (GGDEF)-like protein